MDNLFRELADRRLTPGQQLVSNNLIEQADVLAALPMYPTNNGLKHVFRKMNSVEGAKLINLDDELSAMSVDWTADSADLSAIGGEIEVGEDEAAEFGGHQKFFAEMLPSIFQKTGMDIERSYLYNTLRKKAISWGNVIDAGGAVGGQSSVIVVKYVPGETGGIYDPKGWGTGKAFDVLAYNGGQLYKFTRGTRTISGYGMRVKTYLGFLMANPRNVAVIVNVDLAQTTPGTYDALPTKLMMNKAIRMVRGTSGNTMMYTPPAVVDALGEVYKSSIVRLGSSETEINTMVEYWNKIRLVSTYNMDETEAVVS